jgi:AcrR family transcriptional regulator
MAHGTDRFRSLDPKKRAIVLDAASHEFATFGYLAASTNRIAATAKISKGALFSYFPTKEMLFAGVLGELFDSIEASDPTLVQSPETGSLAGDLAALAERTRKLHRKWPRLFVLGHELRFQGAHIPDRDDHQTRIQTFIDRPLAAAIASASTAGTLAKSVAPESALLLAGAVFDNLRAMLTTNAPEIATDDGWTRTVDALIAVTLRAISA